MLLMTALVRLVDEAPPAEDVVAGPWAALIFVLLIGALVVLGFSLVKQLRRAQAARDAGVYGDDPVTTGDPPSAEPHDPTADGEDPPRG